MKQAEILQFSLEMERGLSAHLCVSYQIGRKKIPAAEMAFANCTLLSTM
jgi:hypothetical protein